MNQNRRYDAGLDEALLEHYDDLGDHRGYQNVLERMRQNGYRPQGPGAPLPGSPYYRDNQ